MHKEKKEGGNQKKAEHKIRALSAHSFSLTLTHTHTNKLSLSLSFFIQFESSFMIQNLRKFYAAVVHKNGMEKISKVF